jgi:hypothetical protein
MKPLKDRTGVVDSVGPVEIAGGIRINDVHDGSIG